MNKNGYIVRCNQCGYFQIGFMTSMLTLSDDEFINFSNLVRKNMIRKDYTIPEHSKSIVLHTTSPTVCLLLTQHELKELNVMLDAAENECRALEIIGLFQQSE